MGKWDRPWQNMILHHLTPPKKSSEASSFQYQHISTTNEYFRALFCVTQIATVWHGNGVEKTCWNSWTLKMIYRSGSMHQALNTSKGRHLRTRGYPKKNGNGGKWYFINHSWQSHIFSFYFNGFGTTLDISSNSVWSQRDSDLAANRLVVAWHTGDRVHGDPCSRNDRSLAIFWIEGQSNMEINMGLVGNDLQMLGFHKHIFCMCIYTYIYIYHTSYIVCLYIIYIYIHIIIIESIYL